MHESQLLAAIEKRIGASIASLGKNMELPPSIGGGVGGGGVASLDGGGGVVTYGKARGGGASKETSAHLEAYAPAVRRLAQLEVAAQCSFWDLKRKLATR